LDWYAARAAGVVAYVLLSTTVTLGIALAGKLPGRRWRRWPAFAIEDVHRAGGLLVGTFIAIHVATIAIDSFLPFSPAQLLIPLTSVYRPVWVALGIVAAELLLALAITNRYRDRVISRRWWRRAHYVNFAVWTAATLHGMGSGTDRSAAWLIAIYAACAASVAAATIWRIAASRWAPRSRSAASGGVALCVALLVVAAQAGPLHAHTRPWDPASFRDTLTGQILQETAVSRAIVSMSGQASGTQNVLVRADLLVTPAQISKTRFQMEYLPSGTLCVGTVLHVAATSFTARCTTTTGAPRRVAASWQLVQRARLRGTLTVNGAG
jgi:sulfoxide reductase heme-binding subunit YedZ